MLSTQNPNRLLADPRLGIGELKQSDFIPSESFSQTSDFYLFGVRSIRESIRHELGQVGKCIGYGIAEIDDISLIDKLILER